MPEWMKVWGIILVGIGLSGITLALVWAIIYGAYAGMKYLVEERRYKRWAEKQCEPHREGKRVT